MFNRFMQRIDFYSCSEFSVLVLICLAVKDIFKYFLAIESLCLICLK